MNTNQVRQLAREGTYEGNHVHGELIETHISWVILGREYTFKLKKPMQYHFLDFSTVEKRKYYCEREVFLNRRLSDIYLDVVPVRKAGATLSFEGDGETIDHAVRMRTLDNALKMDQLLSDGEVTESQMKTLARKIANFHKNAEKITGAFDRDRARDEFNDLVSVSGWLEKQGHHALKESIHSGIEASEAFLDDNASHMEKRVAEGFWRDVHGDLHAKNIFLYKDPVIFDCIEFSDAMRQIDLLNEVAFFCMDLEAGGHHALAHAFLDAYLNELPAIKTREDESIFVYYKAYRANVRAKVNTLRAMQINAKNQREQFILETKRYLHLMQDYFSTIT